MKRLIALTIILPIFASCQNLPKSAYSDLSENSSSNINPYSRIMEVPVPMGYRRVETNQGSFGAYLRNLSLRPEKTVYLYNGKPKNNQEAQFAVVEFPLGNKDLQQCADVIMRLRAEYFYKAGEFQRIRFNDNAQKIYSYQGGDKTSFEKYLETVFSHCGTISLEHAMVKRQRMNDLEIGDVLIQGGSPGHAMIIVDLAINDQGGKLFMLAQGYMPAQQLHIVKNPTMPGLSPWYRVNTNETIITPEWNFKPSHLKTW